MKTEINIELFKATFYADLTEIKKLVKSKNDLQIKIPIKEGDYHVYWEEDFVSISLLDILNWASFTFYEYSHLNKTCHKMINANNVEILNDCINPKKHFKNILNCIVWICNEFSITNYHLKDYTSYSVFGRFLFSDQNYLDDDEIKESLESGFRLIDLDLINKAIKGNGKACYELIKKGADYKIDPLDYSSYSLIYETLSSDNSFHTLQVISYLCHKKQFYNYDPYEMLSSLYNSGVSNYILDIILMNENIADNN